MGPQSCKNPKFETFKCHLDVGLVERHIVYYKGEGDGFPQVQAMVNLVSSSWPMARPNTKSAQTRHLPTCCLVCVGPCEKLMFVTFLSPHPKTPTRHFTPKVL